MGFDVNWMSGMLVCDNSLSLSLDRGACVLVHLVGHKELPMHINFTSGNDNMHV